MPLRNIGGVPCGGCADRSRRHVDLCASGAGEHDLVSLCIINGELLHCSGIKDCTGDRGENFTGNGEPLALVTGMLLRLITCSNLRSTGDGEQLVGSGTAMLDPRNRSNGGRDDFTSDGELLGLVTGILLTLIPLSN